MEREELTESSQKIWFQQDGQTGGNWLNTNLSKNRYQREQYSNLVMPNTLLLCWRGWWSRMEAEGSKDLKDKQKEAMKEKS